LIPTAEVSVVEVVLPKQCGHCGRRLKHTGLVTTEGETRRHQVPEMPAVQAHVTEYQFPNVLCGDCGNATRAPLPEEIAGHFGPQLTALIAYWTVVCRLPRRLVEAMLADVLGIQISWGSTQKAWEEVSQAVAQPVRPLQEQLPREAVLNVDETGWRTNGDKRWIWGLAAHQFVFYVVASTRGAEVLVSLLGAVFRGILCCDRWVVYLTYHSGRMQLCWAHLKRNILGIADYARSPSARQFCRDALAIVARLFRLWYRFRGDLRDRRGNPQPLDRRQLLAKSIPLQKKLFALAEAHLNDADREVRNLATALLVHFERLFTFLEEEGVEPTNNVAERILRTAVQWRKISFGNRSSNGEIATARLLTVTQTCKRQQRHVLGYLTDAVRCHRCQAAPPSLVPSRH
jgi:transposase